MLVCSALIISRLHRQSKFQMFTLFSGRRIVGEPRMYINMASSYWALEISAKNFIECLNLGKLTGLKLREVSYLAILYRITISKLFPLDGFRFIFLLSYGENHL